MDFICDIHNHIAVKTYLYYKPSLLDLDLLGREPARVILDPFLHPNPEVNVWEIQSTIPKLRAGGVTSLLATHYVPEYGLVDSLKPELKTLAKTLAPILFPELWRRIEDKNPQNHTFMQTLQSINVLEEKVREAAGAQQIVTIPKSNTELDRALGEGKIVFLHALEGAHHLGRNLSKDAYLNNLHEFFRRGVCYITLAHFFENDFVTPVEGLPPDIRSKYMSKGYNSKNREQDALRPLKDPAVPLVNEMFDLGIIVDLTHTSPAGRRQVFELNDKRNQAGKSHRPVIMSHVGVQGLFNNPRFPTDRYLGASDDDIQNIKKCNGVIGIIFYNYWLTGKEEVTGSRFDFGREYIYQTIEYIFQKTQTYDNIAIGTDFDGMTDPPDDYYDVSRFHDFRDFLNSRGIPSNAVDAIMGGNMRRVLREGWGR